MDALTQEKINDAIELLVRTGKLVAYRDPANVVRFAKPDWARRNRVAPLPLTEVQAELAAHEAQLMAKWN